MKEKKNNGITLIALVITIVVLLILAGITISQLSENGLFEKAKLANEESKNAQLDESDKISKYNNEIKEYIDGNRDTVTISTDEYNRLLNASNQSNYSTEEQKIGTWIDGKPLYQKTVVIDYTTSDMQKYNHNISNVDTIYIDIGNTFFYKNNEFAPFFASGFSAGTIVDGYNKIIQTVNRTQIQIRSCNNAGSGKAFITLKYTKTTDTATN